MSIVEKLFRVPVHGNMSKSVTVNPKATEGAIVGVNLFDQNGNIYKVEQIVNQPALGGTVDLSNFTTDDLDEGAGNLYFTVERVYETLKTDLVAGDNVTLTPDDGAQTITISAESGATVNYAVNGAFDVWQRGQTFPAGAGQMDADCWQSYAVGSTVSTTRQSALASGLPTNARYFARDTVVAGSADSDLAQRILRVEDVFALAGKSVRVALYCRASVACTIGADLGQLYGDHAGSPMYGYGPIGRFTQALLANVWTPIESAVINLPPVVMPYAPDPGTSGLQLSLWMNAGPLWESPGFLIGFTSGTFDWALVSISDSPLHFVRTPLDETIRQCQRYTEKSFPLDTAPIQNAGLPGALVAPQVVGASSASALGFVTYKANKQRKPTVTLFNPLNTNSQPRNVTGVYDWSAAAIIADEAASFGITATSAASSSAGQTAAVHWFADASINPMWTHGAPYIRETDDGSIRVTDDGSQRRVYA